MCQIPHVNPLKKSSKQLIDEEAKTLMFCGNIVVITVEYICIKASAPGSLATV
jgi:hypothetical protein